MNPFNFSFSPLWPWIGGFFYGCGTLFGSLAQLAPQQESWYALILQAGMMGIVLVLLLKVSPAQTAYQKEQNERYLKALEDQRIAHDKITEANRLAFEATITRIVAEHERRTDAHERQMEGWRVLLEKKGYCPVRDKDQL